MREISPGMLMLVALSAAGLSCGGGDSSIADADGGAVGRVTGVVDTGRASAVDARGAGTGDGGADSPADSAAANGSVTGTVTLLAGGPAAGVTVTLGQGMTTTAADGSFSFTAVAPVDRAIVTLTKKGYVSTAQVVRIRAGVTSRVDAAMAAQGIAQEVDATAGGTASNGTAIVVLPAGALVDASGKAYTGKANVALTPFDPTTTEGQKAFPGDFQGVADTGETIPIMSYGYMDVTVSDTLGNSLQLASGKSAEISIPIPAGLVATAPQTMPLWYFNPSDGQWHQVGMGQKSGNVYKHTIPHFSMWNTDVGYSRSYVKGRVIGCDGKPLAGAEVRIRGISPRNCWTSGERSTDQNGSFPANDDPYGFTYAGVPVDASGTASIVASKAGVSSVAQVFSTLAPEQVLNFGDICVCATGVCGAKDAGVPEAGSRDAGGADSGPTAGSYSYRIYSMTGSCVVDSTEISGSADVVISGSQLTMTLYNSDGDPLVLTGTISSSSWSVKYEDQFTWNSDKCIENDAIKISGTVSSSTFAGDLVISEAYSGDCPDDTNCQTAGKFQLTKP